MDAATLSLVQAGVAAVFLVLLLRIALLLGATPVRAMAQELLYLRGDLFRPLVRLVVLLVVAEGVQLLLPGLAAAGTVPEATALQGSAALDLLQALLLVVLGAGTLRAFSPYSRRSLEDLETVARRGLEGFMARLGGGRGPSPGTRRGP